MNLYAEFLNPVRFWHPLYPETMSYSLTTCTLKSYIFLLDWTCHPMYLRDMQVCVYINVSNWMRNVLLKRIWSFPLTRLGFDHREVSAFR